ncbi:YqzL family protein [Aquibacillus salsiterrae]|uniref:YqzL family protein n=1 Tax=Aquibacillus salsiterrae TaxID=2950439 RepID=A0A9X4ADJ5_9BACI|nr:YqzL family protein [Aquibacillus salsiterrae]MDC3415552.1 YqzL family protein [Aquibacillus salsiterrae]
MLDFTWKIFSQTGNIETYLLMKELESDYRENSSYSFEEDVTEFDTQI